MKTHHVHTIEKPYKMTTKNAKKIEIFNFCWRFKAIFEKTVFLKNGHGRLETGAMPTNFAFIFHGA